MCERGDADEIDNADDRNWRSIYVNGFSASSVLESDFVDYFGLLFNGHVRGAWIDKKFGCHAMVEFDDESWATKAIDQRKHYLGDDRSIIIFAWKCCKGSYSKRDRKRKRDESRESEDAERKSISGDKIDNDRSVIEIRSICDNLLIDKEEYGRRRRLKEDLEKKIMDLGIWPRKSKLFLFGSSINGFGWKNSDIDLTLIADLDSDFGRSIESEYRLLDQSDQGDNRLIDSDQKVNGDDQSIDSSESGDQNRLTQEEFSRLDEKARLEILASCLRSIDPNLVSDVVQIYARRCPVIKFTYRHESIANRCEISIDNRHAIKNTLWLYGLNKKYRFLSICYSIFRWWLEKWKIVDKRKGSSTFNGYTLALVVVSFCQHKELESIDQNKIDPIDLFHDLIRFLSGTYLKQAIFSPRLLYRCETPIESILEFLLSDFRSSNDYRFSNINVQDPFDRSHNTALNVSEESVQRLKRVSKYWWKKLEKIDNKEAMWKIFSNSNIDVDLEIGNRYGDPLDLDINIETTSIFGNLEIEIEPDDDWVFICEPTADQLLSIKKIPNIENKGIGEFWLKLSIDSIWAIFSEVLKFRVAYEETATTSSSSDDDRRLHCLAWHATWLSDKRKSMFKKLIDDQHRQGCDFDGIGVRSRFDIEERISSMMVRDDEETAEAEKKKKKKKKLIEPVAEFSVILKPTSEKSINHQLMFDGKSISAKSIGYQKLEVRVIGEKHVSVLRKFLQGFIDSVFDDAMRKAMNRYCKF